MMSNVVLCPTLNCVKWQIMSNDELYKILNRVKCLIVANNIKCFVSFGVFENLS